MKESTPPDFSEYISSALFASKEGMIKEWEPVMMEFKECG